VKRPKNVSAFGALAIIVILSLIFGNIAMAADSPSMGEILVTNNGDNLIFFSYLKDGFTDAIDERLQSALSLTFNYQIELKRKRFLWSDPKVADKIIVHRVKYDPLKKEYVYTRIEGKQKEERVTKDYDEMRRWITYLDGVKLGDYSKLESGKKYYVRIKAEIEPLNTPFPLKYLKFLFPFLDQDTSWQESVPFVIKAED